MCSINKAQISKGQGRDLKNKQFNIRFYGNPGTGKTTVARHYANLLKEMGILPQAEVMETSGAQLVSGGVTELKALLAKIPDGGVLFIDEVRFDFQVSDIMLKRYQ